MFGWSDTHIMNMPASRFFCMLNSGRKITDRINNTHYLNMCDVNSIAIGNNEYFEQVRKNFYYKAIGKTEALKGKRALDPEDPIAVKTIESFFKVAQRVN